MKIEVVAGIVEHKGTYLVGHKVDIHVNSDVWEFPGGKIEIGESIEEALRREWREELDIEVTKIYGAITTLENDEYRLHFCPIEISGIPAPKEHIELSWLEPWEMKQLSMHSLDSKFVLNHLL